MTIQFILEDGKKRTLKEFAEQAVSYLEENRDYDEVVQIAENITELEQDFMTRPENIHELPSGYQYYFSGFFGQVIGIGHPGIIH